MRVAVLTVSDSVAQGLRPDGSGPALAARCRELSWDVVANETLADDCAAIQAKLTAIADAGSADVILTTGGTGLGPRDVTPEATQAACERLVPGLAELMRSEGLRKTRKAALSRAAAGVRARTLIVNLPGSPRGAVESFDAIAQLLPHAIDVMHGARHD
jgi:molybdenum cofactor synthesis domain-containing protein